MVKKLFNDLDIFSPLIRIMPQCIQALAYCLPVAASLWAISFSWCGNSRSLPPPWMSKLSPRQQVDITEHSMCQPGRPGPHGDSQLGSPGLTPFHSTKSSGSCLASSTSIRAPMRRSSIFLRDSLP
ncbi:hypothetical protein D3C72_1190970 [compost metagenome]